MDKINLSGDQAVAFVNAHDELLVVSLPMDVRRFARLLRALERAGFKFHKTVPKAPPA